MKHRFPGALPILTALLMVLTLPSCKKSSSSGPSSGSGYYMKFKLNGVQVEYDSQPIAALSYSSQDSIYTCVIAAYKDVNAGLENAIAITVLSNSAIVAGAKYDDPAKAREVNGEVAPQNTTFYYDSTANAWLTMGNLVDANGNVSLPGIVANAQLTITELTSSYMKGTFSGTVYKSSTLSQYYSITEGEFYLKRS